MHLGVLCVPRAMLQCTVASLRDFCAFMLQHHPTPKAPIQCKVHYVSIPILEVRQIKRALAASAAGRGRGRGRRVARSSLAVRKCPLPVLILDEGMVLYSIVSGKFFV